jgi:hypothetical protein
MSSVFLLTMLFVDHTISNNAAGRDVIGYGSHRGPNQQVRVPTRRTPVSLTYCVLSGLSKMLVMAISTSRTALECISLSMIMSRTAHA